ncbi:uncharacterized protein LOC126677081 [Mercurialis annua]|uniref:uncharacterized protein LOC126677081 n=1 Tax=Mercurialis annua TaxID=3986 RepID=UPI00215E551D|nr:uncharacterized protein LOC126677081 [Mercurialis annua]
MATFHDIDTVKAEKADAMRRYKRHRILTLCLNSAVTFALLSCFFIAFFPLLRDVASSLNVSALNKPLFIFILINSLVFLIYNFSSDQKSDAVCGRDNLYDQYVSLSSSRRTAPSDEKKQLVVSPEPENNQSEDQIIYCDKQIVHCENASANHGNPMRDLKVMETDATSVDDTEEKRFKRTQSEKYETEKKKKKRSSQRRVLRRSETEINGREMVVVNCGGDRRQRKSIKDMNNEEFNLTIESFIASKKKSLRDEHFAVSIQEESISAITCV